jgi:hypothetical protein
MGGVAVDVSLVPLLTHDNVSSQEQRVESREARLPALAPDAPGWR